MANSLSAGEIKYCPFCGEKMPLATKALRFCPSCGEKIAFTKTMAQLDNNIEKTIMSAQSIRTCNPLPKQQANRLGEFDYYSIILKDCLNPQSLAYRLEKLLLRSYSAIRLAVETAPCTVIYKGKVDNIVPIIKAFKEEKTAFSLTTDDLNKNTTIEKIFTGFDGFNSETQQLIRSVPVNLWLGDNIYAVIPDAFMQNERTAVQGVLVVTNQALYLIYGNICNGDCQWIVIPYYQLAEVSIDKENSGSLVLIYKDNKEDDIFFINDQVQLADIYEHVRRAANAGMSSLLFKTICENCGYIIQEKIDLDNCKDCCDKCGQKLSRKLLKRE